MTKAVVVRKSDHTVVGGVVDTARPQWIVDPETKQKLASPAVVGWENDDYRLCELVEFSLPEGKVILGEKVRTYDAVVAKVFETAEISDASEQPLLKTDPERLERAVGLTVAQIRSVLGIGDAEK